MPRRNAVIIVAVAALALVVGLVVLRSRDDAGSTATFCASARSGENPLDTFDRYDPANPDAAQLARGVDRLQQLERAAPDEIKPDMKVLVDAAQQFAKALDSAAKNAAVPDLSGQADRVRSASANVTRFAAEQCNVSLDSGSTAPGPTVPTTVPAAN